MPKKKKGKKKGGGNAAKQEKRNERLAAKKAAAAEARELDRALKAVLKQSMFEEDGTTPKDVLAPFAPVSYTHLTLPTIYSV